MNHLQEKLLEMLVDFDAALNKSGVRYFLSGGTALGAMRSQGFIPWDDDVDVFVLKEDEEAFIEAVRSNLDDKKYYLQMMDTGDWQSGSYKVKMNGTTFLEYVTLGLDVHNGVSMDVFVMEGFPVKGLKGRLFNLTMRTHLAFSVAFYSFAGVPVLKRWALFMRRTINRIIDRFFLDPNSEYVRERNDFYKESSIPRSLIGETRLCEFEGHMFPVVEKAEDMLTTVFGDYMKLPPEEERIPHHFAAVIDLERDHTEYPTTLKDRKMYRKKGISPY